MRIEERTVGDVKVLDVSGQITIDQGHMQLKDKINSLVGQGSERILINLGSVTFVDSTGLGELVAAFTTMSKSGGQMKLVNVTKRINDLLVITKLVNVFDTFDNEPAAIESFARSAPAGSVGVP
jgi:anti-sigma B factor antagonist